MSEASKTGGPLVIDEVVIKKEPDVVEIDDDDDICELEHLRKLFVGGLAPYTNEENLKAYYGQWGKVVDVVVMRDSTTKRSRGFGFITYTNSESVNKAQANRPHIIDGKTVEAKRALQRPDRENREANISVKKLFVGGLKDNHDEDNLKEYFSQFGKVLSVKLLMDKTTGKRRGFAFVEFDDYDSVDKAILQKQHSIKYVIVDVKKSVYKQELQNRQNRIDNMAANGGINNFNTGRKPFHQGAPNAPPVQHGYQMSKPPQAMPYQQPPPPMNGPQQGPPANYNYWGPPPPIQPYGNGYQQPPPQPPMNNWNYSPAPNTWNAGPPQPPPAGGNWQPNQWGYGPPPAPAPPANWNSPPAPPVQQVPPPGTPSAAPSTHTSQPPPVAAAAQPNFGSGYQQNYGGGPVKHNAPNGNRMNPYNTPPTNTYASNGQASHPGYGNNSVPVAARVPPVGGSYHR